MGQYNSMSYFFKEFGFPVLEELLKESQKKQDCQECVIEVADDKKEEIIEVRDETQKV